VGGTLAIILTVIMALTSPTLPTTGKPVLRDLRGRLVFSSPRNDLDRYLFDMGATSMIYDRKNRRVGVYVDDTTPHLRDVAVRLVAAKIGMVIVGIAMGVDDLFIQGVINAKEWYPYGSMLAWGRMPRKSAYILQWNYKGFHGDWKPNNRDRALLLLQALLNHPKLILLY
jgi:hypothetical protein